MSKEFNSLGDMGVNKPLEKGQSVAKNLSRSAYEAQPAANNTDKTSTAKPEVVNLKPQDLQVPLNDLSRCQQLETALGELSKMPANKVLNVKDPSGNDVAITVAKYTSQLKGELNQYFQLAITNADAVDHSNLMPQVKNLYNKNQTQISQLEKQLNIDPKTTTMQDLEQQKANTVIGSQKFNDITQLINLVHEQGQLNQIINAAPLARYAYARAIAQGLTQDGKPSKTDMSHAELLVKQAQAMLPDSSVKPVAEKPVISSDRHNSGNSSNSDNSLINTANNLLAKTQAAQKALDSGNTSVAQANFKDAELLAKNISIPQMYSKFVTAANAKDNNSAGVYAQIIQAKENLKIDNANYLNKTGNSSEAFGSAIDLMADNSLKLVHNNKDLVAILTKSMFANTKTPGELMALNNQLQEAFNSKDKNKVDALSQQLLNESSQTYQQSLKTNQVIQAKQTKIDQELKSLSQDNNLDSQAKKFEQARLQARLHMLQIASETNSQVRMQYANALYIHAVVAKDDGNDSQAYQEFTQLQKNFSDFANNKSLNVSQFIEDTKPKTWYQSAESSVVNFCENHKAGVIAGTALVAGGIAALATVWSGPGAAVAGAATDTAVGAGLTALLGESAASAVVSGTLAVGAASLAGGAADVGAHQLYGDKFKWSQFGDGAYLGAQGGLTVASFGLGTAVKATDVAVVATDAADGARVVGAVGDVADGTKAASAVRDVAESTNLASKADEEGGVLKSILNSKPATIVKSLGRGINRYSLSAGLALNAPVNAYGYFTNKETLSQAALNTTTGSLFSAMAYGTAFEAGANFAAKAGVDAAASRIAKSAFLSSTTTNMLFFDPQLTFEAPYNALMARINAPSKTTLFWEKISNDTPNIDDTNQ